MSKLERDIAVLQDHLEIHKKEAITWASKLQDDGQAYSFHDPTTQHVWEILEREKCSLHFELTNMEESEHKNTLQLT